MPIQYKYLFWCFGRRVLIDTGEKNKPEYLKQLHQTLTDNNISIGHVVITHWHHDHVGGLDGVLSLASKGMIYRGSYGIGVVSRSQT